MKLISLLFILWLLSKCANGSDFTDCLLRQTITESESKFSDRLDVASPNSMTFCYAEEFERCYTTYYNGTMVCFVVYKVTQRHAVGMEKQLTWKMIFHNVLEKTECLNYPQFNLKPIM